MNEFRQSGQLHPFEPDLDAFCQVAAAPVGPFSLRWSGHRFHLDRVMPRETHDGDKGCSYESIMTEP